MSSVLITGANSGIGRAADGLQPDYGRDAAAAGQLDDTVLDGPVPTPHAVTAGEAARRDRASVPSPKFANEFRTLSS